MKIRHRPLRCHATSGPYSVIMPGTVIIHVQSQLPVQFLAVVLVRLVGSLKTFSKQPTKEVVVVDLLDSTRLVDHHPVVSLVVLQVVVISRGSSCKSNVSLLREDHAQGAVLVHLVARILRFCRCVSRSVSYALLAARGIIPVGDGISIREGYDTWQI